MARKIMGWKTKGMNQDLSVSAFNPEFSFENMNLRLSTNENNTMMSWVNEKGTAQISLLDWDTPRTLAAISGIPIGTAVLNHQLVVFTTNNNGIDRIYILKYVNATKDSMLCKEYFSGNLNFNTDHPLETLVSYEADHIQKVYWTDGYNQPRMANIAKAAKRNATQYDTTQFDFIPAVVSGSMSVEKAQSASGVFPPGVIQYCFTYFNKYGQQSNIVDVSSLFYLAHGNRGASPEDKVNSSFEITISSPNTSFDYIRIYSIQRTSINAVPIVKQLNDIKIPSRGDVTFVDNGTTGLTIDPTELLFVGGKEIHALTMTDKDNTLFLGNIEQVDLLVDSIQAAVKNNVNINFSAGKSGVPVAQGKGVYSYKSQLGKSSKEITTFKGGETYRFGFQLQKKNGEWTEPIFIKDEKNDVYPSTRVTEGNATLVIAQANINLINVESINNYVKARPLVVYPSIADRTVLCQGVLNPTVFNIQDRKDNSPFAQASWFFRPFPAGNNGEKTDPIEYTTEWKDNPPEGTHYKYSTYVENVDKQFDENGTYAALAKAGNTRDVYALVMDNVTDEEYNTIAKRGALIFSEIAASEVVGESGTKETRRQIPFWGAIKNGNNNPTSYIFLADSIFPEPYKTSGTTDVGQDRQNPEAYTTSGMYFDSITYMGRTVRSFKIDKRMRVGKDKRLYLVNADNKNFTFKFATLDDGGNAEYYKIIFIHNTIEFSVNTANQGGKYLAYKHFESLFCQSDIAENDPVEGARQVEIQGSGRIYDTVYGDAALPTYYDVAGGTSGNIKVTKQEDIKATTNTQFFVDQHIVTLNSPDIEFDTDVQNYDTEGLSLRIVGAIPITASASAHHIKIKSPMLQRGGSEADSTKGSSATALANYALNKELQKSAESLNTKTYGSGERSTNLTYTNVSTNAGRRQIAEYLWQDGYLIKDSKIDAGYRYGYNLRNYMIFPWQRVGSLNNDWRSADEATSQLDTKKISNILFSSQSVYQKTKDNDREIHYYGYTAEQSEFSCQMCLTENAEVMNYRLPEEVRGVNAGVIFSGINYYPNIDKVLYNENYYPVIVNALEDDQIDLGAENIKWVNSPISMKYKSTSHAVLSLGKYSNKKEILPAPPESSGRYGGGDAGEKAFWGEIVAEGYNQAGTEPVSGASSYSYLWLGELIKTNVQNRFGGDSPAAIRSNNWMIGGDAVNISNGSFTLTWTEGDTYYQRYDCLKTYPFTNEDPNQIVEILSFMCETHVNLDGRYDRNRGQTDNTNMHPRNFNLLNPVYSQQNNFFTSRKIDTEGRESLRYPNHVFYTKTKQSGADVDLWTNATLASILELDGDKGEVKSLQRFNNQLIAFQDTGISQILYNENTQISTTDGVPIEIANSGKVQGKRYLSDTIGCSNKWSISNTPGGIYFMDSHDKNIYLFNGQLHNLSGTLGFNTWAKKNIPTVTSTGITWTPTGFGDFVSYYDRMNQDVLFINSEKALAYSEKVGAFTSFYSYGGAPYFCNFEDTGVWIKQGSNSTQLWKHRAGDTYCNFFGASAPYWMTLVGNPEPQLDKIFTNLEFRATVDGEGTTSNGKYTPYIPFDKLETWNEYQHGVANLGIRNAKDAQKHHSSARGNDVLKRKFRIWRCDIPRDNDTTGGRTAHPIDRMRNPWLYLKLLKNSDTSRRTEIHDLLMTYFG